MRKFEIVQDNNYQNGKITVYNDGKEKYNSWEARLQVFSYIPEGGINLDLVVYEDSKENALNELNTAFDRLMLKFKEDWNLDE